MRSIRTTATAIISLIVVAAMLAPLGAAQNTLTLKAGARTVEGIQPGLGGEDLEVEFVYTFRNQGTTGGSLEQTYAQATVSKASCDNNNFIVNGPGAVIIPFEGQDTTHSAKDIFTIEATRDAPGLTPTSCEIIAAATAIGDSGAVANSETEPYSFKFTSIAGYYGAMSVNLPTTITTAAPYKEVPFTMELTNFGNANTRVTFEILEGNAPEGERWTEVLPTDVIVGSAAKGQDNTATATFQVSTPYKTGWNNVVGSYRITMNTEALDDPEQKGNTMTADVLIRVRGVYVPGFEAVAVVGGLLGSVIMVRRRQE